MALERVIAAHAFLRDHCEMELNCIYGLASTAEPEFGVRYVGMTRQGVEARLRAHVVEAGAGKATLVYRWMRRVGVETITATVLEVLPHDASLTDLLEAESRWMRARRRETTRLLNVSVGVVGRYATIGPAERRALDASEAELRRSGRERRWHPEESDATPTVVVGSDYAGEVGATIRWVDVVEDDIADNPWALPSLPAQEGRV